MGITKVQRKELDKSQWRKSEVAQYIYREFEAIKKHLKDNPPTAKDALKMDFQDVPGRNLRGKKANPNSVLRQFRKLLYEYIRENGLSFRIVGGRDRATGNKVLFIVTGDSKSRSRAA